MMRILMEEERSVKLAPLYIKCQYIGDGTEKSWKRKVNHGPRRALYAYKDDGWSRGRVQIALSCGCDIDITYLPIWERKAVEEWLQHA